MPNNRTSTALWPQQTRVIHAEKGMRLHVVSGRLWVTQPHALQDVMLCAGSVMDLTQDWTVVGTDAEPRDTQQAATAAAQYRLEPTPRSAWSDWRKGLVHRFWTFSRGKPGQVTTASLGANT